MNPEPHLYTIVDASKTLGIGRTKLYELIDAELIRPVSIGHRRLIPADELRRYVDRLVVEQHGEAA